MNNTTYKNALKIVLNLRQSEFQYREHWNWEAALGKYAKISAMVFVW